MQKENKDKDLFDKIAHKYSKKDTYPTSRLARKFQLQSLVALISRDSFDFLLDLGSGPGFNASYLKGRYNRYLGIDYSKKFIEISKELHPDNNFVQGNIKYLDDILENEKPDVILGVGILHHVDDLDEVLQSLRRVSSNSTILAFVEPSNGNPIVQLLRWFRKYVDNNFNDEQVAFSKNKLINKFNENGFEVERFKYQGYISPPFAQVIFKPIFLFYPICKVAIAFDKIIQVYFNNRLSWNLTITARVRE